MDLLFLLLLNAIQSEDISFQNFNQSVELVKVANGYKIANNNINVKISHSLIVKSAKNLQISYKNNTQIKSIKQLYIGSSFKYYLFEIKQKYSISKVMEQLKCNDDILLVQPDILQLSHQSQHNAFHKRQSVQNNHTFKEYLNSININKLWKKTKGKGIKIAIIDDGFDMSHDELKHVKNSFSYDALDKTLTANPKLVIDTHGTKISGIIFAQHDNKGIEGIAPDAELIALRQPDTWTSKTLLSFQLAKLSGADIINCSWNSSYLLQPIADVIDDLAKNGRAGKGTAVVIAAGNNGIEIMPHSIEAAIESALVIGSSRFSTSQKLKFSNYGDSVDLMVLGNGVLTTGLHNKYTKFAGTSLSAAIVSGLSALILAQHPEYTLKELEHELIKLTHNKDK